MDNSSATRRHRTPVQILGPYFPTGHTPVLQYDLTSLNGIEGQAQGEIIEVTGRVLNLEGEPVRNIPITVWQANTFGRYAHGTTPIPRRWIPASSAALAFDQMTTGFIGSRPSSPARIPQGRTGCARRTFTSRFTGGSSGLSLRCIFLTSRSMPTTDCSMPRYVRIY